MNEKPPPKKLVRSRTDRYIGGVAGGLAARFDIDPIFVRIGFVLSLIFGGLGLLAYGALLALMPVEGDPAEPLPPIETKRRTQMIGLAAVVGIIAIATADSGGFAAWIFAFWPGTVFGVLFWVAAGIAIAWLFRSGTFSRDRDPGETASSAAALPATPPSAADPSTAATAGDPDPPTYGPEAATQASTEMVRHDRPATAGKVVVWFAIGLTALIVFCLLFVFSVGTTAVLGGLPMALLVIVLGTGMVFAGLRGRRQLSLWLLTAAVAVTIPMAAVSIADLRVEGNYGDINETPLSIVEVPVDGYQMAAGNMTVDLRRMSFDADRAVDLPVRSGMGLTSIVVPDGLCVTGEVSGKAGIIHFRGREENGIDISRSATAGSPPGQGSRPAGGEVRLDAEFKLGAFEVVDHTEWRESGRGGSFGQLDSNSATEERRRATEACSRFAEVDRGAPDGRGATGGDVPGASGAPGGGGAAERGSAARGVTS